MPHAVAALKAIRERVALLDGSMGSNDELERWALEPLTWINARLPVAVLCQQLGHFAACLENVEATLADCAAVKDSHVTVQALQVRWRCALCPQLVFQSPGCPDHGFTRGSILEVKRAVLADCALTKILLLQVRWRCVVFIVARPPHATKIDGEQCDPYPAALKKGSFVAAGSPCIQ